MSHHVVQEIELGSSGRAALNPNHWAMSPAPEVVFKNDLERRTFITAWGRQKQVNL